MAGALARSRRHNDALYLFQFNISKPTKQQKIANTFTKEKFVPEYKYGHRDEEQRSDHTDQHAGDCQIPTCTIGEQEPSSIPRAANPNTTLAQLSFFNSAVTPS
jgi:hypothetical protein